VVPLPVAQEAIEKYVRRQEHAQSVEVR
jgi:hypothetical protein